ncbi:NAD(P) transhydrogenase subunit alpha [Cellulophaga baltica]|uniref:NAD(P) transhydrogenase subunit alpha n=1 Tax=Cellulophaga baltica TaxID=76594 RepID=UPI001C066B7A|nr:MULTISPECIES: NAD(P) transhydrogenase subunit alpha [Cellulophaga]MBU2997843.1 NAD(P) transhydrogenase subunit alpha [Cellulophaga baltica]MDO6769242.1 NAD(P) transhydrogenase subunit alpha [Cellulophaga sp. 1_MG-2023]
MQDFFQFITDNEQMIYLIILMMFLGVEVISQVPSILHTPLMSGANAIHGVIVIGAIIVMGESDANNYLAMSIGFIAVIVGTLNVVGGFVVTDKMLGMFKSDKKNNSNN